MSGGEYGDQRILLRSNSSSSEGDLEGQRLTPRVSNKGIKDLIKRLDRGFSFNRRQSIKRSDRDQPQPSSSDHGNGIGGDEILGESAPPEWALLPSRPDHGAMCSYFQPWGQFTCILLLSTMGSVYLHFVVFIEFEVFVVII